MEAGVVGAAAVSARFSLLKMAETAAGEVAADAEDKAGKAADGRRISPRRGAGRRRLRSPLRVDLTSPARSPFTARRPDRRAASPQSGVFGVAGDPGSPGGDSLTGLGGGGGDGGKGGDGGRGGSGGTGGTGGQGGGGAGGTVLFKAPLLNAAGGTINATGGSASRRAATDATLWPRTDSSRPTPARSWRSPRGFLQSRQPRNEPIHPRRLDGHVQCH